MRHTIEEVKLPSGARGLLLLATPDSFSELEPLRRHRLAIGISVGIALLAILGITAFVVINRPVPYTPHRAAQALCTPTAPDLKMTGMVTTSYGLPDVGRPAAIIVAPACLKNRQVPVDQPGHYLTEVNVYIMLSHDQLVRLLHIDGVPDSVTNNMPYSLDPIGLTHLLTHEQMRVITTGSESAEVNYFVTDGPMPKETLSYQPLTAPYDLLTGVRYNRLPFRQMHQVYQMGNPIMISGH